MKRRDSNRRGAQMKIRNEEEEKNDVASLFCRRRPNADWHTDGVVWYQSVLIKLIRFLTVARTLHTHTQ